MEAFEDTSVQLHEDDLLVDVGRVNFLNLVLGSSSQNQKRLLLELLKCWWFAVELNGFSSGWDCEQVVISGRLVQEVIDCLPKIQKCKL